MVAVIGAALARAAAGGAARAVAISPSTPTTVYASASDGVFRSDDAGASWEWRPDPTPGQSVHELAVDPTAPDTVYAGTWCHNSQGSRCGIYKTTDGGTTWSHLTAGLPSYPFEPVVGALVVDHSSPSTLYAGVSTAPEWLSAVYKSIDAGATWVAQRTTAEPVNALAVHPTSASTVYAALGEDWRAPSGGVLKTTDGGVTWSPRGHGVVATTVYGVAVDERNPTTAYAAAFGGVFKTTDGGASWEHRGLTGELRAVTVDPSDSRVVFAGGEAGVYRSDDGGETWAAGTTSPEPGFCLWQAFDCSTPLARVEAVVVDPQSPSNVYAAGRAALYRSRDGGRTWAATCCSGLFSLAIDPVTTTTVYAGGGYGISKTTDGGTTWEGVNSGLPGGWVTGLAVDPQAPATVYAAIDEHGLYQSTNGGISWSEASAGLGDRGAYDVVVDPSTPTTLYAATYGGGVYVSTDAAASWAPFGASLGNPYVLALAVTPDGTTVHAATAASTFTAMASRSSPQARTTGRRPTTSTAGVAAPTPTNCARPPQGLARTRPPSTSDRGRGPRPVSGSTVTVRPNLPKSLPKSAGRSGWRGRGGGRRAPFPIPAW